MNRILLFLILIATTMSSKAQNPDFISIVEYATKAPSGHNTQPWLFLITESTIEIHPNHKVALPVVDSDNRELYISLGCALENLCLAAQNYGYSPKSLIVRTDTSSYIDVKLTKGEMVKNLLFDQISKRQSNRSVYNGELIEANVVETLAESVNANGTKCHAYINGSQQFDDLLNFITRGNQEQMEDELFKNELLNWIRFNKKHSEQTRTGLSNGAIGSPSLPLFMAKPIVRSFLNPKAQNKSDVKKIKSSSHLLLLTTDQNTPETWIMLGQSLQQLLLMCTQNGIAVAFQNQPCEIKSLSNKIQRELLQNDEIPTILLRIGFAKPMPYSLRKNVDEVIL